MAPFIRSRVQNKEGLVCCVKLGRVGGLCKIRKGWCVPHIFPYQPPSPKRELNVFITDETKEPITVLFQRKELF